MERNKSEHDEMNMVCSHPSHEEKCILVRPDMWVWVWEKEVSKRMRDCQDVVITVRELSSLWEGKDTGKWQEVMRVYLPQLLFIFYDVCFCKLRDLMKCLRSDVVPECVFGDYGKCTYS
jgi:hypothetical protein